MYVCMWGVWVCLGGVCACVHMYLLMFISKWYVAFLSYLVIQQTIYDDIPNVSTIITYSYTFPTRF